MYQFVFVDDEDYIRELFGRALNWEDFHFELTGSFANAEDTLAFLQKQRVDVVISDIKLGSVSGLELVETIKQRYPSTIIVLISGYRDFEDAFRAIKINVFDYILKPISQAQLKQLFQALYDTLSHRESLSEPLNETEYFDSIITLSQQYIHDNLENNLCLEMISSFVHMNPTYFSSYFKKKTGKKLIDYITEQRVQKSIELMKNPTLKIYDISMRVGYRNLQHFYKIFKAAKGYTPSEYRKQYYGDRHHE